MRAPKVGTYTQNGRTLNVEREGTFLRITVDGETFQFNEAGILMEPYQPPKSGDLQDSRPRVKVPKPPRWP